MEAGQLDVLDRYSGRLEQCLEPCKLLRYLSQAGVLDEDDVEEVRRPSGARVPRRVAQVQTLLDILRRRERGMEHFIKALLTTKTQDYLGRELLEDDYFTEKDISAIIKETERNLDESRTLKLKLLEQSKKKERVQSSRSSVALSDSGCDPDERTDHDDGDVVDLLMRELERERKMRQDAEKAQRFQPTKVSGLARKQGRPLSELGKSWSLFRSVDLLSGPSEGAGPVQRVEMYRSASLNVLNDEKLFTPQDRSRTGLNFKPEPTIVRCPNEIDQRLDDGTDLDGSSRTEEGMDALAGKVADLERKLKREKALRERSEKEIVILCQEKEELCEELDETRHQLHMSLQDLSRLNEEESSSADSLDAEFDTSLTYHEGNALMREASRQRPTIRVRPSSCAEVSAESPMEFRPFSASKEYYSLSDLSYSGQLGRQSAGMKMVSSSWWNLNVEHYELDDYNSEIDVEQEKTPLGFLETLRKLRLRTKSLYENAVNEGKDLELLRDKVGSGCRTNPRKSAPTRRHSAWLF